jgi:putative peptidoglycan lipid II flippase
MTARDELAQVTGEDTARRPVDGQRIARGAAVIAGLTILSRVLGLVRTLVFSQTVGATCLGTAYVTANQVPNLVYELVLGGALSSAMVPVLARSAERSAADPAEKARAGQISSALLTWSVLILVPLSLVVVVAAGPAAALLNPANRHAGCVHADVVATTAGMLRVFAPQVVLYGLSVVLFGLLQAYRRFAGYALAPVISSMVLIASYLAFAPLGRGVPLARLPMTAQLVLSVGTTMAIAALVLAAAVPAWRLRLRLRPALRFPPGVVRRAGGLAMVGVVEIIASDMAALVAIALANGRGTTGALVLFNYAYQVFTSINSVLAVSIVVSVFPVLAARDGQVFDGTCAGSTRAVVLATCLGMAVTAAVAVPAAHVLAGRPDQVSQLILGFVMFAPGLVGMGVIANLARVMLAIGRLRVAAVAVAGSWVAAMLAQVVLTELVPGRLVVAALALGTTIGMTVAAIPLVIVTRRIRGKPAVHRVGRATLAGLVSAAAGTVAGLGVSVVLPMTHKPMAAGIGVLAAGCAVIAFGIVAFLLDSSDLRALLTQFRQIARLRPRRRAEASGRPGP